METSEVWRVYTHSDTDANDSNKTLAVLDHAEYQILWIWVELTTSATVGNRQIEVRVEDQSGDVIACLARASVTQAASLTRNYLFAPAIADLTAFRDTDYLTTPVPATTFLDEEDVLRILDNNAVDAAADDMIVHIQYAARSVLQ